MCYRSVPLAACLLVATSLPHTGSCRAAAPPPRQRSAALQAEQAISEAQRHGSAAVAVVAARRLHAIRVAEVRNGIAVADAIGTLAILTEAAGDPKEARKLFLEQKEILVRLRSKDDWQADLAHRRAEAAAMHSSMPAADRASFAAGLWLTQRAFCLEADQGLIQGRPASIAALKKIEEAYGKALKEIVPVVERHPKLTSHPAWGLLVHNIGVFLRDTKHFEVALKMLEASIASFEAGLPGTRSYLSSAYLQRAKWHH